MEEREYYKKIYSKFWINQTKKYGFGKWEKFITKNILKNSPKSVFEVGIGTGYPIATAIQTYGEDIKINGCDVAGLLVEQAKHNLGLQEGVWTGSVEELDINRKYDCVYCARTSWYIPDFYQTLEKMIALTNPGGRLVFDIMDEKSLYYWKMQIPYIQKFILGTMKIQTDEIVKLHFYSHRKIEKFLKRKQIKYKRYSELKITGSSDYFNTPKKLFVCQLP